MLIELRIRDYAVIDELALELAPGLNVLTGETGAGKSIIVGALSLLLGERASSDVVRAGAAKARVEGVFDVSKEPETRARMEELGFEAEEGLLILRREVAAEGRNRAWVNGSPATAGAVGELGARLVDLHGQHEHQTLLRPDEQRAILDGYADARDLADRVGSLHGRLGELRGERRKLEERKGELESRVDFLRFQLGEIEKANPEPGEDAALEEEGRRLEHSEELARESRRLHQALYGGERAVADRLAGLRDTLRRLSRVDSTLESVLELLEQAYHQVSDVGRRMADYASSVEHDPGRLEEIRARQDALARLKRKYGPALSDVLATACRVRGDLRELESASLDLDELDRRIEEARTRLVEAAGELGRARRAAGADLARAVQALLPDLGMPEGVFRVDLEGLMEPGPWGGENVEFVASLNPGFEPRPLKRIASGGELSRVMLALKAILAALDRVPTLVFDEIDAGVGGVVAGRIAEKLAEVADRHQVFVITHLPQLASRAHHHLFVEKSARKGVAATSVSELGGEARVREIARMLGGDPDSATSREHARELLHAV